MNDGPGELFANAPYHAATDPLDRILAYVDFRKTILTGDLPEFTCFAGTMVQETYATHPQLRAACESSICGHAETLEADIEEAIRKYGVTENVTAGSLARHTQCVIQGAFILAKAIENAAVAAESIDHIRLYLALLFRSRETVAVRASARRRSNEQPTRDGGPL